MMISRANSIRFFRVDALMRNFDNSGMNDAFGIGYCIPQKFLATDQIPLQVYANTEPTVIYKFLSGGQIVIYPFLNENGYYCYKVNQRKSGYIEVLADNVLYRSEIIEIVEEAPNLLLQWYNFEDSFGYHYRDDMMPFVRFDGQIRDYSPKIVTKVYDNQNELTKVSETIYRQIKILFDVMPQGLAEKIILATAHDIFVVNDVEYVSETSPVVKQEGNSNLMTVEMTLVEKFAIGENRHDKGYVPTPKSYYIDSAGDNYTDINYNRYTD